MFSEYKRNKNKDVTTKVISVHSAENFNAIARANSNQLLTKVKLNNKAVMQYIIKHCKNIKPFPQIILDTSLEPNLMMLYKQ